jgi:glycosyltransferase involved in cell wall biosynthesis
MENPAKNKPSVSFILAAPSPMPVGGLRIIYEYATRLSQRGWQVNVIHPARLRAEQRSFIKKLFFWIAFYKNLLLGSFLPKKWFQITPNVKMLWVPDLSEKYIPDADYIIACPVQVSSIVNSYGPRKGKKYYFIQHFEDWVISSREVEKTWKLPLKKMVIAKWLLEKATQLGEVAIYIPNGLDFSSFGIDVFFHNRKTKTIFFLSHFLPFKGTIFAIDAVKKIKDIYPETTVFSYGVDERPLSFPDFITYYKNPSQKKIRALYNQSQVFLSPSLSEGWPLPPAEAMLCGCLVIATDINGHREYIFDNENGILCIPKSSDSLVEKISWVFNNPEKAESIAIHARESLKKFDWDSRVSLFENALIS